MTGSSLCVFLTFVIFGRGSPCHTKNFLPMKRRKIEDRADAAAALAEQASSTDEAVYQAVKKFCNANTVTFPGELGELLYTMAARMHPSNIAAQIGDMLAWQPIRVTAEDTSARRYTIYAKIMSDWLYDSLMVWAASPELLVQQLTERGAPHGRQTYLMHCLDYFLRHLGTMFRLHGQFLDMTQRLILDRSLLYAIALPDEDLVLNLLKVGRTETLRIRDEWLIALVRMRRKPHIGARLLKEMLRLRLAERPSSRKTIIEERGLWGPVFSARLLDDPLQPLKLYDLWSYAIASGQCELSEVFFELMDEQRGITAPPMPKSLPEELAPYYAGKTWDAGDTLITSPLSRVTPVTALLAAWNWAQAARLLSSVRARDREGVVFTWLSAHAEQEDYTREARVRFLRGALKASLVRTWELPTEVPDNAPANDGDYGPAFSGYQAAIHRLGTAHLTDPGPAVKTAITLVIQALNDSHPQTMTDDYGRRTHVPPESDVAARAIIRRFWPSRNAEDLFEALTTNLPTPGNDGESRVLVVAMGESGRLLPTFRWQIELRWYHAAQLAPAFLLRRRLDTVHAACVIDRFCVRPLIRIVRAARLVTLLFRHWGRGFLTPFTDWMMDNVWIPGEWFVARFTHDHPRWPFTILEQLHPTGTLWKPTLANYRTRAGFLLLAASQP